MTAKEELRALAKRHAWAFKELTYDALMSEANQLYAEENLAAFKWLREYYSGAEILLQALAVLKEFKQQIPAHDSRKELLKKILKQHPWVTGEIVRSEKERHAREMFVSLDAMYRYLKSILGSRTEVVHALRWLLQYQKAPRKTLCL